MSFVQKEPVLFDFYRVKNIRADIYQDDDYSSIVIEPRRKSGIREWNMDMNSLDLEKQVTSIILEIEYENGMVRKENFTSKM